MTEVLGVKFRASLHIVDVFFYSLKFYYSEYKSQQSCKIQVHCLERRW